MAKNVPLLPEERVKDVGRQTQAAQGAGATSQIAQGIKAATLSSAQGEDNIYRGDLEKDLTGNNKKGSGAGSGGGGYTAATENAPAATPNYDRTMPSVFGDTADPELVAFYQRAMQTLEDAKGQRPTYGSQYDEQIKSLYDQIMGRGPFKYDSKTDPLYQQYVQDYTQQGKMAMRDTMGRAAALTGGYGSSYAQSVGQQQYDQYLQRLAEVLPETYGMALNAWNAEGDQLNSKLATTTDLERSNYNRYLDELSQYNIDVQLAREDADTAYERAKAQEQENYNRQVDEYNRQKDAYNRLLDLIAEGYAPTKEEYAAAGLSEAQGEALRGAYAPAPETKTVYVDKNRRKDKAAEKTVASATSTATAINKAVNNIMKHLS